MLIMRCVRKYKQLDREKNHKLRDYITEQIDATSLLDLVKVCVQSQPPRDTRYVIVLFYAQ